jgi:superfamily II DNA or RNA helicase
MSNSNNLLKISNDYSYFISDDMGIKHVLWDKLRFRERNYFHNRRYKQRLWDGYTEFFKIETGKFLTGLLPEVQFILDDKLGVKYQVIDERQRINTGIESVDDQFLNRWLQKGKDPITLHDYQVEFINLVNKHHRGVVFAPTSAGKTNIMVGILKALPPGTPTLILQNRAGLAQQNYDEICQWGFPGVGAVWGGTFKPNLITVATVQSAQKIERLLPKFKALIVDEIHDMMSAMPKAVYRRMKLASVRIAMSATPFKFGETDTVQKFYVKGFFGPVLKLKKSTTTGILTTQELQNRGILSASKCIFYPIDEPKIPHDIYMDAVTRGIAESYYFHDIVKRLATQQTGRTLILVDRIAHGDALHSLIPGSLWVQGKDNATTRKSVIKQLQKSSQDVVAIATQQIFNTGINVFIHNLINAAGGQADHLIVQRMGRGLRKAEDKAGLNYYDFVFDINDYLLDHSKKRIRILQEQGHEVIIKDGIDF